MAHGAHAFGIGISIECSQAAGGMHKTIQQQGSILGKIETVGIAVAFQPGCAGVEDAAGGEMEGAYAIAIISGISEVAGKIVGIAAQANAGAIVIDLAEICVKGAVFLHHEDDVVYALQAARRGGAGRGSWRWTANRYSLTAGENTKYEQTNKQGKTTYEGIFFTEVIALSATELKCQSPSNCSSTSSSSTPSL